MKQNVFGEIYLQGVQKELEKEGCWMLLKINKYKYNLKRSLPNEIATSCFQINSSISSIIKKQNK